MVSRAPFGGRKVLCFVRDVASTFTRAIQQFSEGTIDAALAQRQHDAYVAALRQNPHVADVIHVPADDRFPDCVFIEDTAVYANGRCVITNPGAESRRGEEAAVRDSIKAAAPLAAGVTLMAEMHGGATCDGGDVLATDDVMFVGISSRTNMHGFRALASAVGTHCDAGPDSPSSSPFPAFPISLPDDSLHLKSVVTSLGPSAPYVVADTDAGERVWEQMAPALEAIHKPRDVIRVPPVGANILRVGATVYYPANVPEMQGHIEALGLDAAAIDNTEMQKADGALTCCSVLIPVE